MTANSNAAQNQATHIFAENPAAGNMKPVRFIRWFDNAHTYARVEFKNGYRVSVPAKLLLPIAKLTA